MISESSAFHTAIFDALCACLNLTEAEGLKLIHEAYAEPENVPRPARMKNVIYWTSLQDMSSDPISTEWNNDTGTGGTHVPTVCTTVKYNLVIVCYGPACEEYVRRIRNTPVGPPGLYAPHRPPHRAPSPDARSGCPSAQKGAGPAR